MFSGIVEELGTIASLTKDRNGARLRILAETVTKETHEGDSVAVNGVCLTALDVAADSFCADISRETLERSTIGHLGQGSAVNLERAVTPSTRLGGHIVQGHVDQTGTFIKAVPEGDFFTVRISYPREIGQYLVDKGSISVEGISLTIANLTDSYFEIAVIPKTWSGTNLSKLKPGNPVNLEADIIAKYVERIMLFGKDDGDQITFEKLRRLGFS